MSHGQLGHYVKANIAPMSHLTCRGEILTWLCCHKVTYSFRKMTELCPNDGIMLIDVARRAKGKTLHASMRTGFWHLHKKQQSAKKWLAVEIRSNWNDEASKIAHHVYIRSKMVTNETTHLGVNGFGVDPKRQEEQVRLNCRELGIDMVDGSACQEMISYGILQMQKYAGASC
jgi:hypothetical protein